MDYQLLNIIHARYKRMKKVTKKILTSILAAAMVLGMSVTALAADTVSVTDTSSKVVKEWTVAEAGMFKDGESFEFELAYAANKTTPVGTNETAAPQYNGSAMDKKTATISGNWATNAEGLTSSNEITYAKLFEGVTFSKPGTYYFTLTEKPGSNPNVTYDTNKTYSIAVRVVWDNEENPGNGVSIVGIQTWNGTNTSEENNKVNPSEGDVKFNNTEADSASLEVKKVVKGNAANKDDVFTFDITVIGTNGVYNIENSDQKLVTEDGVGKATVTLKHGQSVKINNLPLGLEYSVVERASNYDSTEITVNGTAFDSSAKYSIAESGNVVEFTNIKNLTTPTGVFMDIMPYIVLFGAAIIACAVFFASRRRRSF